jgi:hypothetical protein
MCEPPLMRSNLLTEIEHVHPEMRNASFLVVHAGFQK